MKRINNKGFTLVELIATILLLALVMGIGAYSITSIINKSKEKDYELLIKNIIDAVELNYQECMFSKNDMITCPSLTSGYYNIKLGTLIDNGFLKGNSTNSDNKITLVNPKNNNGIITDCDIKYRFIDGKIEVVAVNPAGACPTSY